jgi:PQQ-like domain
MVRAAVPLVVLLAGAVLAGALGSAQAANALTLPTLPTTSAQAPPVTPPPRPAPQTVGYGYDAAHDFAAADPSITVPLGSRWSVATQGDPVALVAADGLAFALVDTPSAAAPTGASLLAFDPGSGVIEWSRPVPVNGALAYASSIIAVAGNGHVHAFMYGTGADAWDLTLPGVDAITPAGGELYADAAGGAGTANTIDAINVTTGKVDWSATPTAPAGAGPLAVAGDRIYRAESNRWQAFNRLTGNLIWQQSNGAGGGTADTATLWQTQLFRVGFTPGSWLPETTVDGGPISASTGFGVSGSPAELVSGEIGLQTSGAGMVATNLTTNALLWSAYARPLATLNGDAITSTSTGIQLHDLITGKTAWSAQLQQTAAGVVTAVGNGQLLIGAGGHVTALVPSAYATRKAKLAITTPYAVYGGAPARGSATITEPGIALAAPLSVAAEPWPFKHFAPATTHTTDASGKLAFTERPALDTIYRVSAAGSSTALAVFEIVALPHVSYLFGKPLSSTLGEVKVTLSVPRSIHLAHHRISLYLGIAKHKTYVWLGTGTLAGGNGHFAGRFTFKLQHHLAAKDFVTACFAGLYKQGMSFGDHLDRHCGAQRIGF